MSDGTLGARPGSSCGLAAIAVAFGLVLSGILGDPAQAAQIAPNPNLGVISVQGGSNDVDFLNHGELTVSGSFFNTGSLTNHGVASLENLFNVTGGSITNHGTLTSTGTNGLSDGSISNYSTWVLSGDVLAGGSTTNFGDIQTTGNGSLRNYGDLVFAPGSTFAGSLHQEGGSARIFGSAQLDYHTGFGLLEIESGGTATNTYQSTYNLSVGGTFTNLQGAFAEAVYGPEYAISVISGGTFLNEGTLYGDLVNNAGTFTQTATGTTQVEQLTNLAGGVLTADGTWDVANFVNQGTATISNLNYATRQQTIHNDGVVYTDFFTASPYDFHQGPNGRVVVSGLFHFYAEGRELEGTVQGLPGVFADLMEDSVIGTTGRLEFDTVNALGSLLNKGDIVVNLLSAGSFENEGFFSGAFIGGPTGLVNRGHAVVSALSIYANDPTIINQASGLLETRNLTGAVVQNDGHWITRGIYGGDFNGQTSAEGWSVGVLEHTEGTLDLYDFHLDGTLRVGQYGQLNLRNSTIGPALTIENSGYLDLRSLPSGVRPTFLRQLAGATFLDSDSAPHAIEIRGGDVNFSGDFVQGATDSLSIVLNQNDITWIQATHLSFLGRVEIQAEQPEQLAVGMEFIVGRAQGIDLSQVTLVLPDLSAWLLRLAVDVVDLPSSPYVELYGLRVRVLAIPEPSLSVLMLLGVALAVRSRRT